MKAQMPLPDPFRELQGSKQEKRKPWNDVRVGQCGVLEVALT